MGREGHPTDCLPPPASPRARSAVQPTFPKCPFRFYHPPVEKRGWDLKTLFLRLKGDSLLSEHFGWKVVTASPTGQQQGGLARLIRGECTL